MISHDDANYLITKANKLGAQGYRVTGIVLPTSATHNITDTVFLVDKPQHQAWERPWYER